MESVEVNGVKVEFDKAKLADPRFITLLGDMDDDSLDFGEKAVSQSRILRFVFGRAQRDRIMDELAAKGDGDLSNDAFSAWWVEFLKAANAKN